MHHFALSKMTAARLIRTAEVSVSYQGGNHSLSWITTYGVEQSTADARNGEHDVPNRPERNVRSNFAHQRESWQFIIITVTIKGHLERHRQAHRMACNLLSVSTIGSTNIGRLTLITTYSAQSSSGGYRGLFAEYYFAGVTYHY